VTSDLAGRPRGLDVGLRSLRAARLRPAVPDEDLGRSLLEERYRRFGGGLEAALAVEVDLPLPDDMLAKVDRTSMAHALEVRAPFPRSGARRAGAVAPLSASFRSLLGKRLLRRALRTSCPTTSCEPPSGGFEVRSVTG